MQHSSATISDGGLVRRTLAGDPDGFGELHRRYYARVVGVVTGILKDRARAEEEVQEAYLTALESLPRLADRERFYPWLRRIAVNRAIEAMAALAPSNSSRVLIKGVRLAAGHIAPPAVREALRPLLSGGVSTSVQLAAIDALSDRSAEAQVRAIVSAALDPDQSA